MATPEGTDELLTWRLVAMEKKLVDQHEEIEELKKTIVKMEIDAINREKARLRAGLGALGSLVLFMAGVIWAYRGFILK
tara:strand:- start:4818 stop:5054 length:237 start_codon:yes stop_codon:yes gene_type:complete